VIYTDPSYHSPSRMDDKYVWTAESTIMKPAWKAESNHNTGTVSQAEADTLV